MKHVFVLNEPCKASVPSQEILNVICGDYPVSYFEKHERCIEKLRMLKAKAHAVVVANSANFNFFESVKNLGKPTTTILLTAKPMNEYSADLQGQEDLLVDHLIVAKTNQAWTINQLRVTLHKILGQDIFGLEKYLAPGTSIKELIVRGSSHRERYHRTISEYAQQHQLGQNICRLLYGISEEMLMNAVYDAPVASGIGYYRDLPRDLPIELRPKEYAKLRFAFDGEIFGISAVDPFGALKRDRLFKYLKKVLHRHDSESLIDSKKGGAGLGIFKILYSSHALICNVDPNNCTEIIALIDVQDQLRDFSRMARSIHYFESA